MELYLAVSFELSRKLTLRYSSSFGFSSRLFHRSIRNDIYAVYGLVRIADEIVDTYRGKNAAQLLANLEEEVYAAIESGFSTNMIVHAFAHTANVYGIKKPLIAPFFESMRMDIAGKNYSPKKYKEYIHGSAEVIGLMCLKIFCQNDAAAYQALKDGAAHLGSAYQKINFLRDMRADYEELGRIYFPGTTFQTFDNQAKKSVINDIKNDLEIARGALKNLPSNSKRAVAASYGIYACLLRKLEAADSQHIKHQRIRVSNYEKIYVMTKGLIAP